jgi:hypothetical protein
LLDLAVGGVMPGILCIFRGGFDGMCLSGESFQLCSRLADSEDKGREAVPG